MFGRKTGIALLALVVLCATTAMGETESTAYVDGEYVYFSGAFSRYYVSSGACDSIPHEFDDPVWYTAWKPQDSCDAKPTTREYMAKGGSFCHFRILSSDGSCLYFDSRLDPEYNWDSVTQFALRIHIGSDLTVGGITFPAASDFDQIDRSYYHDDNFALQRDMTYKFQIVHQLNKCDPNGINDPETPATTRTLAIPCCLARVGDANCSGGDEPTIADINAISDMLFGSGTPVCCMAEADVNKSGGSDPDSTDITIGDISVLTDYLFIGNVTELDDCY